jgi:phosphonate transport system substrate-binding protein
MSARHGEGEELRLLTYLAPGLPRALFRALAVELGHALGVSARLACDSTRSGPVACEPDPFTLGQADVGFLCAPGYLWLAERQPSPIELVPAALVFDDPRCAGRPVYFADLVVRADSPVRSLAELGGARWVYNDPGSLSGYFSVLSALRERGFGAEFFGSARALGSHHAALAAVARGAADCAAIDSNTLALARGTGGARGVRVLRSFGPFAVQPVVVRAGLALARRRIIAAALLAMHTHVRGRAALARHGVVRFAPISAAEYERERVVVAGCAAHAGARTA